jgi:hypothetical protein
MKKSKEQIYKKALEDIVMKGNEIAELIKKDEGFYVDDIFKIARKALTKRQ